MENKKINPYSLEQVFQGQVVSLKSQLFRKHTYPLLPPPFAPPRPKKREGYLGGICVLLYRYVPSDIFVKIEAGKVVLIIQLF